MEMQALKEYLEEVAEMCRCTVEQLTEALCYAAEMFTKALQVAVPSLEDMLKAVSDEVDKIYRRNQPRPPKWKAVSKRVVYGCMVQYNVPVRRSDRLRMLRHIVQTRPPTDVRHYMPYNGHKQLKSTLCDLKSIITLSYNYGRTFVRYAKGWLTKHRPGLEKSFGELKITVVFSCWMV